VKPLVMHVRASNFFGGPERQILGHIATSRNARHIVLTFIEHGAPNQLFDRCQQEGVSVKTISTQNPFSPLSIFKLRRSLQTIRPDVICSHGYKPAILSLFAGFALKIPLVMFSRGNTGENTKVRFFENLERLAFRYAEVVVAVSNGHAKHLREVGIAKERIRVIQNAIDTSKMNDHVKRAKIKRMEMGFSPEDLVIATAGRLSPEKAQEDLIMAYSRIQPQFPHLQLLLLGDGSLRQRLEDVVYEKGVQNVHFLGFRRDIDEIMATVDVFVLPSLTEGLPNVILEAFACKKSVVATSVGGVPELIDHGINGLLVQPARPDLLADSIAKCISSTEMMHEMGEAGYRKIKSEFSFEAQASMLEKLYHEVVRT
jgi:glycosyltransferase involved in cell wall biosynthesis